MTYESWAKEYLEAAIEMKRRCDDEKEELKNCTAEERAVIENKLRCRYESYISCMDIARTLMKRKGEC